jgi:hypothetical protein
MFLIRGVLLAGKFRTHHELNNMSSDAQRNTLIVVLTSLSNQSNYQSFDDATLAGMGAVLVFLREGKIRDDNALKGMSADDQRNTAIVEIAAQTNIGTNTLQGFGNIDLILFALGKELPGGLPGEPDRNNFLRGVLLAGNFRSQHDLNHMSDEDQRNTLIVELTNRSKPANFQSFDSPTLAGMGAVLVLMRSGGIRNDQDLKTMTADDQRNTFIVEVDGQTHLGKRLQGFKDLDLARIALGDDSPLAPPPVVQFQPYRFNIDSIQVHTQKADSDHSDSDWMTLFITVADPVVKGDVPVRSKMFQLGGSIKTGDTIVGDFRSDLFTAKDTDVVTIGYLVMNLGSSDADQQFAQAVKITNKIVDDVGPIVGAAIGLFVGNPGAGIELSGKIIEAFDKTVKILGDAFDFLGIHFAPANCNGEVLHDTLTFQPGELDRAANQPPQSKTYKGTQDNDRCGAPPEYVVNFSIQHFKQGGIFP